MEEQQGETSTRYRSTNVFNWLQASALSPMAAVAEHTSPAPKRSCGDGPQRGAGESLRVGYLPSRCPSSRALAPVAPGGAAATSTGLHMKHPVGCPSSATAGVASGSRVVANAARSAMGAYLMSRSSGE